MHLFVKRIEFKRKSYIMVSSLIVIIMWVLFCTTLPAAVLVHVMSEWCFNSHVPWHWRYLWSVLEPSRWQSRS